jgi:sulfatase modifying factor 1
VNVDFCDAAAYCDWAGERLCGGLGGGSLAVTDLNEASKSQWYLACAGPNNERYPYGGFDFKADYCNEYFSGYMADAGKFNMCEGHYKGVYDLVGNAAEWIDSCDEAGGADHSMDNCQLMGGSFIRDDYTCQTYFDSPRNDFADVFGFRCCSK